MKSLAFHMLGDLADAEDAVQRPAVLPPGLAAPPSADPPLRVALERALAALDQRRRMVFVMFEVEGMKHSEIAAILGVSENTSRSLVFEARQQLKRILSEKRP